MKLFRNAIILVVLVGLLVAAYLYLGSRKTDNTDPAVDTPAEEEISIIDSAQDKVSSMEFHNESGSFKLVKKDKGWTMEPEMEFLLDESLVDSAASDFADVNANKIVEENAADMGKYGLDKPTASVKVGFSDGTFKEVEAGSLTPTDDGAYVRVKGENKVYVVGLYYQTKFNYTRGYFAVKDILPIEATSVSAITFEKNGEVQFALDILSENKVNITAPIKDVAEPAEVSQISSAVVQLKIKDVVDETPDLAKYGLDKPAFSIQYGDGRSSKTILFGKQLEKGVTAYARYPDGKSVFTVDISGLNFLDKKFSSLVNSFVFLPNISEVNKVELKIDGKTIVSDITTDKEDSDKDTFKVDGKDANIEDANGKSLFRNFYSAMIGITMYKYEPGLNPSGTPEVTIKYYMKPDSKPVTIEYISKDENYYYAMKDGAYTNRIVLKTVLDEPDGIRATYKALTEAIDKGTADKGTDKK
ncbi:hypothetical protein CLHUN_13520 [Ruminiclostridium hungatei]|uniref:DUF4340 domain-containing protein n=1 Tax=Ruminiclostridium hungatei TaxID=48256 RepID=A0A1V4SLQ1_RUMHU|nr:DUF4340 domain-containing protein [Ruminiclostridium hungatei]OPX44798.1 hypothetical protein CLHUN_13520 [Ruminiclostridium hungatei]